MKKLNRKGFTLVELLAVIVILAILAVAAMTNVIPRLEQGKLGTAGTSAATIVENLANCMTDQYDVADPNICKGKDSTGTNNNWADFKSSYTNFSGKAGLESLSTLNIKNFKYIENGYEVSLNGECSYIEAKKALVGVKKYWKNGKKKYIIECNGSLMASDSNPADSVDTTGIW